MSGEPLGADFFLKHYERMADAPDAVPRLRRFILDLAVRGKLVPQDPNDEPAKVLHAQLAKQFAEQSLGKGRGRRSEIAAGLIDQPPYAAPAGWLWVRMGELGETNIGLTYSPNDLHSDGVPVLRSSNVQEGKIALDDLVRVATELKPSVMVRQGDMLICARNGSRALVGKAAIIDSLTEPMAFGAFMAIFRSPINSYLHLFLTSPVFRQVVDEVNTNTINQITQANLRSTFVALPPLAEQHRIVAKVDELMALCDRLEAERAAREAKRDRLTAASYAQLGSVRENRFHDDAKFVLDALPSLTARPDQIKHLRQTILNLAVRGKLVPQDPNDELILRTLKPAIARRAALVKAKKVREKKHHSFGDLEADSNLPSGWVLQRLGNLVDPENTISYGVLVPGEEVPDGIPFVRAQDLALSGHPKRPNKTIAREIEQAYARTRLRGGEILLCVVGSIGKLGIVPQSWAGANIARAVARIQPISEIVREYLLIVLRGEPVQTYFSETTRTLAQPTLNVGLIEQTPIPLPPIAEQHRIVAKVDELMALCDRLEAAMQTGTQVQGRLLEAVLAAALDKDGASRREIAA